ncbi:MAG: adenylate/guanylate cyclase domain-containing protein [Anaerolineales bacterium]|jgi:class 3 adenylate cyclase|nr:adenylate/guanylate cyclase domain-containing protein [Anaerolineales bacterium]
MSDDPPTPRPRRTVSSLASLFDSIEEKQLDSLHELALTAHDAGPLKSQIPFRPDGDGLRLAPELQTYLPPDLWRKLSGDTPRSGIYINALERLNSLLHTLSTYLPANLVQAKLDHPIPGLVDGKILRGCLLFSDVSGFTALSERLAALGPQGAEHLTGFINQYFTAMIDIIAWSNGILLKFAGDATLIYFPAQENGEHARWAARAGLRMLRAMDEFSDIPTPLGPVSLSMKLGLAAGSFLAASIGSPKRMEYALIGETVSQTLQAEGLSAPGLLVMNANAAEILQAEYEISAVNPRFFRLTFGLQDDLDSFEIRPQKRRARSMPWDASLPELNAELEKTLSKIQALSPYLPEELLDRIISHASQRQVQSEYRPTVVMFCNFTGPETLLGLWGEQGAQRVTGLLSAYFNNMQEAISRFGGIISRIDPYSKGSKLLALFGAPIAHEDDPQRAVGAALAMNSALQGLNRRWAQKLSRHLPPDFCGALIEHRIGITLGETFAGQAGSSTRREYTVMGDEVNLAARLMSAAQPAQILISEPVFERISSAYVTRKLPPVRVKGKKKPIAIFQVDGPRADSLLSRIQERSPLIGRDAELKSALAIFESVRQGHGQLLSLSGPAGIGKSHLADTLARQALLNGWRVESFQCHSYQTEKADTCWIGLVRSLAGITPIDHPLIQAEKLEQLSAAHKLPPAHKSALTDLLGLRQAQFSTDAPDQPGDGDDLFNRVKQGRASRKASRSEVFEQLAGSRATPASVTSPVSERQTAQKQSALAALLRAFSESAPLLIFIEDGHWLDELSRQTLLQLSQALAGQPVLFLLVGRPHQGLPEKVATIELTPLSRAEINSLAAAILTEGLADLIYEQSHGSPLFAEEISRWIKQTHTIDPTGLKSSLQNSDILQKLVLSTIESLPENQREIVRLASVVGLEFRRSDLEALLQGALDPVSLTGYLHNLSQSRLIRDDKTRLDPRYTFEQPNYREILYNSLPFERRRELHALLAEHIQHRSTRRQLRDKIDAFLDDSQDSQPHQTAETLAYHYEMSGQWLKAAQQANTAGELLAPPTRANEALFSRAVAMLEQIPPAAAGPPVGLQKARAQLGLAVLALQQGELPAAAAASEAALSAAPLTALPPELATRLMAVVALSWPAQGKIAQVEKQLDELIRSQPNPPADWRLQTLQTWLAWRAGSDVSGLAAAALQTLPKTESEACLRARALLQDLSRQWAQAILLYQSIAESSCAALAAIRLGDDALQAADLGAAGKQYTWAQTAVQKPANPPGLALTAYRRAELTWLAQTDPHASLALLQESLEWLTKSPPALQTGPRVVVQNALTRIKKGQSGPWEAWRWQPFEDLAYIHLLLPIFSGTNHE